MTNLTLSESVIIWYEKNSRILPWRPPKGELPNPFYNKELVQGGREAYNARGVPINKFHFYKQAFWYSTFS